VKDTRRQTEEKRSVSNVSVEDDLVNFIRRKKMEAIIKARKGY
jgi:hypothetical protein